MIDTEFPKYSEAPTALLQLEGNCGPVTIWATLKYFKKRVSSQRIIEACRYTKKHGTFAIAMAIALNKFGLDVSFYTEPDPKPHLIERQCYKLCRSLGITINSAANLNFLRSQIRQSRLPILLYDSADGTGHFSPLLGIIGRKLILPFDQQNGLYISDFQNRWKAKGICRQCIIVSNDAPNVRSTG
jgi:hypothetical protein